MNAPGICVVSAPLDSNCQRSGWNCSNLTHFKAPHNVTFVKELPKTATDKIQKYILRTQRPAIAPQ
jgi:acyl-coenzyme A synthetase/AMP-(fatty) acid ligase